jgi:hypothetical protein
MAETLQGDITENGMGQGDLVKLLGNLRDVVNELQTDHATYRAAWVALVAKLDADAGITDTDYAASITLPAALTNSTALTLNRG